jgi:hypothetical protein
LDLDGALTVQAQSAQPLDDVVRSLSGDVGQHKVTGWSNGGAPY